MIVRNYFKQLYVKKFENHGEIDKFLEKYNLPKLNEEEAGSRNRAITPDEIEPVINQLPTHKSPGPDGFTGEFYKTFKEELTPTLLKLLQKLQEEKISQTFFMRPASSKSQSQIKTKQRKKISGQCR